jgi:hypothetical protein
LQNGLQGDKAEGKNGQRCGDALRKSVELFHPGIFTLRNGIDKKQYRSRCLIDVEELANFVQGLAVIGQRLHAGLDFLG